MKQRAIFSIFVTVAVIATVLVIQFTPAGASSHCEAPAICSTPQVDGTDFYMFRSYEEGREGFVTFIANYIPLQDPYGGPNYFSPDPSAVYDVHITNDGDVEEDLTFRFRVEIGLTPFNLTVGDESVDVPVVNVGQFGGSLGEDALTQKRTYTIQLIRGNVNDPDSIEFVTNVVGGATRFGMPSDHIGRKSIPDYDAYASSFIHDITIPGCNTPGRLFVGQRRESFAVNLGETFDLVNLNPIGNPDEVRSDTADKNITSFVLEVPTDCLTGDGSGIIGGWTTASLRRNRTLLNSPTFEVPDEQSGSFIQVSRLGNPLVNEVAIGLPDKNLFNASHPRDDASNFLQYVTSPTLPVIFELLFPNAVEAPNNFPRGDLVETFITGIDGVNQDGSTGEIMRLNTGIDPAPRGQQNRLGVIGGDMAGYPNGRRPGDDAVDISLRVLMGNLCHQAGAGGGTSDEFTVMLNGGNVFPPTQSTATGEGEFTLTGNRFRGVVTHNVQNVFRGNVRLGEPDENGRRVCRDATGPRPVRWDCRLSEDEIAALDDGRFYVDLETPNFLDGEIRGQLVPQSTTGIGGCSPDDAPSGLLSFTDGVLQNASQFDNAFPYLTTPIPGAPNEGRSFRANLIDDNLELAEPFVPTDASGHCEMAQLIRGGFELHCTHNIQNPTTFTITKDGPDGEVLWSVDLIPNSPSSGTLVEILDETNYMGRSGSLEIFSDGFESGDTAAWATVGGNSTKIGGPFR